MIARARRRRRFQVNMVTQPEDSAAKGSVSNDASPSTSSTSAEPLGQALVLASLVLHMLVVAALLVGSGFQSANAISMGDPNRRRLGAVSVNPVHRSRCHRAAAPVNPVANDTESQVPTAAARSRSPRRRSKRPSRTPSRSRAAMRQAEKPRSRRRSRDNIPRPSRRPSPTRSTAHAGRRWYRR